jgi:putative lipoic acid-binding regulatory protein
MTKTTLMEFPCNFPVKIIGTNSQAFLNDIKKIVMKHFSDFKEDDLAHKSSQQSTYLAITVKVLAQNQEMLDAFYQDVTKHPDIKMVL